MLQIECFYESHIRPQKVALTHHECALAATDREFTYETNCIVPPNRHFHGQSAKNMIHNHSTHLVKESQGGTILRFLHGNFLNHKKKHLENINFYADTRHKQDIKLQLKSTKSHYKFKEKPLFATRQQTWNHPEHKWKPSDISMNKSSMKVTTKKN